MKRIFFYLMLMSVLTVVSLISALNKINRLEERITELTESAAAKEPAPPREDDDDWDLFILALAWTESRWDAEAVGKGDDVGYLQITPVIIRDANRIVGREKYKLSDRTSKQKSVEIFNVIQDNYNPGHDLNLALKVWNPKAPVSYHRKTFTKYNELKHI